MNIYTDLIEECLSIKKISWLFAVIPQSVMLHLQIVDWDTNQREDAAKENVLTPSSFTPRTIQNPLSRFPASNLQTLDFNEENYLGSAYWEATKFLDRLQQVN